MKLFEPGKIGKLLIKNRILMSSMGVQNLAEPDGRASEQFIDYYVARAKGGTGLVITSSTSVTREIDALSRTFPCFPMFDNEMCVARYNKLAEEVHGYGGKIAVQLWAGWGQNVPPAIARAIGAVGPSLMPLFWDPSITTRELTTEEVERLVQAFEFTARLVSAAEVDAIEINCHGGYLIDSFLSPVWNKRTDKYGGDLDGRLRFPVEIIEAIKKGAGADFPVLIKFGVTHYHANTRKIEDGLKIASKLEAAGADAICADAGSYPTKYWSNPPTTQPMGCLVDLAAMLKKVVKIPVIAIGKLGDPSLAERVLQEGKADFIALGRSLLADPDWANKVKEGRFEDIRPCIGDHEGCHKRLCTAKFISCTVNPATGMERELTITPAVRKKSVLVVGGGPGGMEAARVAALRGHKVTLWERSESLGGNLIPASVPDFKQEYRKYRDYLSTQIRKLGVDIRFGKEATPELIQAMQPEVVFIATGSKPVLPEVPGIGKTRVVTAADLLLGKKPAGESVVVIGGDMIGCEAALYLAQKDKKLTVVETTDSVMNDVYFMNRQHLEKLLGDNSVKILTNSKVLEITDKGVAIANKQGKRSLLEADTVLLSTGFKSNNGLAEALRGKVPEVYSIGDCVEPRKLINAIWEGFRLARLI